MSTPHWDPRTPGRLQRRIRGAAAILALPGLLLLGRVHAQTNPTPFDLSTGSWTLTGWSATAASGGYPGNGATGANNTTGVVTGAANGNMAFQWIGTTEPGGSVNGTAPTANAAADFSCAYNTTSRPRIMGKGTNGFSFINTGSGNNAVCASSPAPLYFSGAALLSINTTGRNTVQVAWTGGTVGTGDGTPTPRECKIQLQYRVGTSGAFTDVAGSVYTASTTGSSSAIAAATLPAGCENQPVVHLRWVYFLSNQNNGGTRPELRVDEITVSSSGAAVAPTTQDSGINFSSVLQNTMTVSWTNGNGSGHVVKINTSNSFTAPANGTEPTGNAAYAGGEQVIYRGTGSTVNVTGLSPNTTYWVRAYGYNGSGATTMFNTNTAVNNPNSTTTQPVAAPTKLVVTSINGGNSVRQLSPFSVTVQAQDNSNVPQNVSTGTDVQLSVSTGTGAIGGTFTGTIAAGTNTVTITGVTYSTAGTGVVLQAARTSGDVLSSGLSAPFDVQVLIQFTAGNLAVERVGDGVVAMDGSGAAVPVFIDEYGAIGANQPSPVNSYAFPNGSPQPGAAPYNLVESNSAGSVGLISRSADGAFLVVPGYNATIGTAGVSSSAAGTNGRTIGMVSADGTVSTPASINMLTANNYRSVASDGTQFWASGQPGIVYVANSAAVSGTSISTVNTRVVGLVNGELFFSTGSGTQGIYKFAGAPPTSGTPTATLVLGVANPYAFAMNASATIMYVATDAVYANTTAGGGVQRYNWSGSAWVYQYTLRCGNASTAGARGLYVDFSGADPLVYATTNETLANRLVRITDTGAASGDAATVLATAGTNTIFRGLALAPGNTLNAPTVQDSQLGATSVLTSTATLSWTNGNGTGHVVKMNTSNSFSAPANGTEPAANAVYAGGEQVIYTGTGNTVNVSGMSPNTTYWVRAYGYNGTGVATLFNTPTALNNPASFTTQAPLPPTKLVVTSVNGGAPVVQNQPFSITLETRDDNDLLQDVLANTDVSIALQTGIGNLSGTTTGTIPAGTHTITISGLLYDELDFAVVLTAARTSGDALTSADTPPFDVLGQATTLNFTNVPANGITSTTLATFQVQVLRDDATVATEFTGPVTVSVQSGPGTISGTVTRLAVSGVASFNDISLDAAGTYILLAQAAGLTDALSPEVLVTSAPALTELVMPRFIGSKTTAGANTTRTPLATCLRFDNLLPNTAYKLDLGMALTSEAGTVLGAGNAWTGTSFSGTTVNNAFTTDANGSSGPVWVFMETTGNGSRFNGGDVLNLRIKYATQSGSFPGNPQFVTTKTFTTLDVAPTALTGATTDDGAYLLGHAAACVGGDFVLAYDNVNGTGDPLSVFMVRQATATHSAANVANHPTAIANVLSQTAPSVVGDFALVIPIGANNPNGIRRLELRNAANQIVSVNTSADGVWGGTNTAAVVRRGVATVAYDALPSAVVSGGGTVCSVDPGPDVTFTFTGVPPFSFTYTDGIAPQVVNAHNSNTYTVSNATAGTYSLTALSDLNCTATDLGGNATVIVTPATAWYADTDGDTYGAGAATMACTSPGAGFVTDNSDDCPSLFGRIGDPCNDNNPFTTDDVINGSCTCAGTPVASHNWSLRIVTDANGGETTYEIREQGSNFLLTSGGPFPSNSTIDQVVSIPDAGSWTLNVFDSGNNGISNGGGYMLRDQNGNRVIDNLGNGAGFTSLSSSPEGFFSPVGTDRLRDIDCDNVERWPFEMIVAEPNPLVSAQWQVGTQTDDGYEFWFTNPNGGYSRHILRTHATSGGYAPANAQRACKLGLATWSVNPLPQGALLNVRIRGIVNGAPQNWGPACRLKVDQAAANCHTTQLENLGANISCGATGLKTNGSSRIWAKPVTRYVQATNTYVNANRYKFHFVNVGENTSFDIVLSSYPMLIYPQYGFQLGATYTVTVQASLDGGNTYCPVGAACQISFAATNARVDEDVQNVDDLLMWPNPNRGDQVFLRMDSFGEQVEMVTVDIIDMFGKRVLGTTVPVAGGSLNTALQLDGQLASGLYLVNLTADGRTITKRLVIQR